METQLQHKCVSSSSEDPEYLHSCLTFQPSDMKAENQPHMLWTRSVLVGRASNLPTLCSVGEMY